MYKIGGVDLYDGLSVVQARRPESCDPLERRGRVRTRNGKNACRDRKKGCRKQKWIERTGVVKSATSRDETIIGVTFGRLHERAHESYITTANTFYDSLTYRSTRFTLEHCEIVLRPARLFFIVPNS